MKRSFIVLLSLFISAASFSQINWNNVKKQAGKVVEDASKGGGTSLSNDEIIKGLKEALNVGAGNASSFASKTDGYFKNPKIFIPFPPDAVKIEQTLRNLGMGAKVDQFNLTLNRAAETAAKEAAPIFLNAVKNMSITDGLQILKGGDNAATAYLKKTTTAELTQKYTPVIDKALASTNATKYWAELVTLYNKVPNVQKINPNLSQYATQKALDGLFLLVADEEMKIRKDPAARINDILKKVFGSKY